MPLGNRHCSFFFQEHGTKIYLLEVYLYGAGSVEFLYFFSHFLTFLECCMRVAPQFLNIEKTDATLFSNWKGISKLEIRLDKT